MHDRCPWSFRHARSDNEEPQARMGNPHPNELKPKASGGTAEAERAAGYYRQILAVPHSTMSCTHRRALPLDRERNRCQKATGIYVGHG